MTEQEWDAVYDTHLKGTFAVCHAAWPHFQKQKYGRIVTTASAVGVHGNFGQVCSTSSLISKRRVRY